MPLLSVLEVTAPNASSERLLILSRLRKNNDADDKIAQYATVFLRPRDFPFETPDQQAGSFTLPPLTYPHHYSNVFDRTPFLQQPTESRPREIHRLKEQNLEYACCINESRSIGRDLSRSPVIKSSLWRKTAWKKTAYNSEQIVAYGSSP